MFFVDFEVDMEVLQNFTPSTRRITFVNLNKFVQNLLSTFCANYPNFNHNA